MAINITYFLIPAIGGMIGWGTNYIAVKMIFRPYRQINILGLKLQGVIPKRRKDLARKISETVSEHLISHEDFLNSLKSTDLDNSFRELIDDKLETFIKDRLFSFSPVIAGFLSDSIKDKIKALIVKEIIDILPEMAEKMIEQAEKSFDPKKIVEDKINSFDLEKLESIVLDIAKQELKTIEILGGVLGTVIGFVQLLIILSV